ncbi:MAG TPA: NgoFVII family restriction endonuclease [Blastocatellia bacterium]|nr:NgoFVII family restriction endonuclease [Blastocatellia bacterium]
MPRIFDNIEKELLPALQETLDVSERSDFCVGYFNLRGWKQLDGYVDKWSGTEKSRCRLLVGMQRLPADDLRECLSLIHSDQTIDNQTALRLKKKLAEEFRDQLTFGVPTNQDEAGLRRLAAQLKTGKLVVKLFLRHQLHAKLYLLFRADKINPIVGYLGSSNLTFSGLSNQGELNIDVLDGDATEKLAKWFDAQWDDKWCIDISAELVEIIEQSWAREEIIPPYHIYVKIAYHLAQEARYGLSEFRIPPEFGNKLFEYQTAAVKIAAHHLNKRNGVLIGDVVGLGKTLMATALAKIFQDDHNTETLILCPKNLVKMWQDYVDQYRLIAKVLPITGTMSSLPDLRRYRIVLIDESHNLRNREGKRYRAIHEYIHGNDSRCILLSATPYNKSYLDLSSQLRLFVPDDKDLGIRPERKIKELTEVEFIRRHQCSVRSLAAFEKSEYTDDWRELMRLYMVRRTRSFIQENYAETDSASGRKFLKFEDGSPSFFPKRLPKTVPFEIKEKDPSDQYAHLYSDDVVRAINALNLPRYGLGNYIAASPHEAPNQTEAKQIQDLSRAGKRLMGFCRVNLFKRLESSGLAFQQSIERHILRNFVFLHAIEQDAPLPIGTQDAALLDAHVYDEDPETADEDTDLFDREGDASEDTAKAAGLNSIDDYKSRAAEVYGAYSSALRKRFKWLRSDLFVPSLATDLLTDAQALMKVLKKSGEWQPTKDSKLQALLNLVTKKHPKEKVIVFTQFADTVRYLGGQFRANNIRSAASVTGNSSDPTTYAWRFSPVSNNKRDIIKAEDELRVLVATDVLSEGQNLQDASIIVNYDLPWTIIRLVQRAGRVDRIGQKSEKIICYSFLPAEGVERLIRLRSRVRQRLKENQEVVGTDEAFFEDDQNDAAIMDLYHEKAGILDGDADTEVDLASYAYQIWKNAIDKDPALQKTVPELPPVVFSTRAHKPTANKPAGVLAYVRTHEGNDALAWIDRDGNAVTESQFEILKAAECSPDTPGLERQANHHQLVESAVKLIVAEEKTVGGQLGRPSGARFRTYERLKQYAESVKGSLFDTPELAKVVEEIYRSPLRQSAIDTLNRQLRSGISNEKLADLAIALHNEDRLCQHSDQNEVKEPMLICSMGLKDF